MAGGNLALVERLQEERQAGENFSEHSQTFYAWSFTLDAKEEECKILEFVGPWVDLTTCIRNLRATV